MTHFHLAMLQWHFTQSEPVTVVRSLSGGVATWRVFPVGFPILGRAGGVIKVSGTRGGSKAMKKSAQNFGGDGGAHWVRKKNAVQKRRVDVRQPHC